MLPGGLSLSQAVELLHCLDLYIDHLKIDVYIAIAKIGLWLDLINSGNVEDTPGLSPKSSVEPAEPMTETGSSG